MHKVLSFEVINFDWLTFKIPYVITQGVTVARVNHRINLKHCRLTDCRQPAIITIMSVYSRVSKGKEQKFNSLPKR